MRRRTVVVVVSVNTSNAKSPLLLRWAMSIELKTSCFVVCFVVGNIERGSHRRKRMKLTVKFAIFCFHMREKEKKSAEGKELENLGKRRKA